MKKNNLSRYHSIPTEPVRIHGTHSLRFKMLIYFGGLFLAMLAGFIVLQIYGMPGTSLQGLYTGVLTEGLRDLNLIADLKKERLQRWLGERRGDARVITNSDLIRTIVEDRYNVAVSEEQFMHPDPVFWEAQKSEQKNLLLHNHLRLVKSEYGLYEKIRIADVRTGIIFASSDTNDIGSVFHDRHLLDTTRSRRDIVFNVQKSDDSGHTYLYVMSAFEWQEFKKRAFDEVVFAVVVMTINADYFLSPLLHTGDGLGQTGEALLVNNDVLLLTHLKHRLSDGAIAVPLQYQIQAQPAVLAAAGHEGMIAEKDYRGVSVFAAFRYVPLSTEAGWGLVVKEDQSEIFSALHGTVFAMVLGGGIGMMVLVILIIAVANALSSPLRKLSKIAETVATGNWEVTVPEVTDGEVGALASVFHDMVIRMHAWHQSLEAEVNARTKELAEINRRLETEVQAHELAEKSLMEREQFLRSIYCAADNVSFVITDLGGEDTRIIDFSVGAEKIFGYTQEEMVGRRVALLHPVEVVKVFSSMQQALREGREGYVGETILIRKGGERFPALFTLQPRYDGEGQIIGTIGVSIDITNLKKVEEKRMLLEEQLRQAEKMQAVGQLAGGIAHDFNNQLTCILGYAELVKEELAKNTKGQEYVDHIVQGIERSADLTGKLLAFARKGKYQSKPLDVHAMIEDIIHILSHSLDKRITMRTDLRAVDTIIIGDPTQLQNAMLNIALNARDAMPDGGEILFATENVFFEDEKKAEHFPELGLGKYIKVRIVDSGCGMDAETQKHIFEPFFTTKVLGEGTGMGLSAVYGTIQMHNGGIRVDSRVGFGTEFVFFLPVTLDACVVSDPQRTELVETSKNSCRILVVDDEAQLCEVLRQMLNVLGHTVTVFTDSHEAIAYYQHAWNDFDLVILDMIMPKFTGEEVYDRLREINEDIRVLLASGYSLGDNAQRLLDKGARGFIQKPFLISDLARAIETIFRT